MNINMMGNDTVQVNGVDLPLNVIAELRKTGIALSWYNAGELNDAILACAYDSTLVDDVEGEYFRDRLNLTHEEKLERQRRKKLLNLYSPEEADLFY